MSNDETRQSQGSFWLKVSTPATIALFAVVGGTGLLLLFDLAVGTVKHAHEWLGAAFVGAGLLHAAKYWRTIQRYLRDRLFVGTAIAVTVATLAFVMPPTLSGSRGGNPTRQVIQVVVSSPLDHLATLLNKTPDTLVAKLRAAGVTVESPEQTLEQIERQSGRHFMDLLATVMSE